MRKIVSLAVVFACLCGSANAAVEQVFYIGNNNNSASEFDHEGYADDHYYWENGDYSGLGTGGGVWTAGQEIWNGGDSINGFERALVTSDPSENIYFQLDWDEAGIGAEFTFVADIIQPSGLHDLTFSMNGVPFHTETNIGTKLVTASFSAADVGAMEGPNVITMLKTNDGGWTQFDYVSLSVRPIPEPATLLVWSLLAGVGIAWGWRRRTA